MPKYLVPREEPIILEASCSHVGEGDKRMIRLCDFFKSWDSCVFRSHLQKENYRNIRWILYRERKSEKCKERRCELCGEKGYRSWDDGFGYLGVHVGLLDQFLLVSCNFFDPKCLLNHFKHNQLHKFKICTNNSPDFKNQCYNSLGMNYSEKFLSTSIQHL